MDRASRLDAAELLHDALDGRPARKSTSELSCPPRHRADEVIRFPHGSRRHLAQLVDVRIAQVVDVRLRRRDDDLLFPRVLTDPRDALAPLLGFGRRTPGTEGSAHLVVRHPQHLRVAVRRGLHEIEVLHLADVLYGHSTVGLQLQYFVQQ